MNSVAIRALGLGKAYSVASAKQTHRYRTLREELQRLPRTILGSWKGSAPFRQYWALDDVSFEVGQGEVLGVVGRNGAGKSTLLKILSRITEPTSGTAELYGRVGSLLEVGTGFHPELTGRENVYLSGAVLGMRKAEIRRRFDEIVEFAEITDFIDTPAKRYSSGMYMRLAFSVAAHLEPEILLVDEVLAVGDAAFQKKCLRKMDAVSQSGRTILFVSHNLAAVQQLCQKVLLLDGGRVTFHGDVEAGLRAYTATRAETTSPLHARQDRKGNGSLVFERVSLLDRSGNELSTALSGDDLIVRLAYRSEKESPAAAVCVSFNIRSSQGYLLANCNSVDTGDATLEIRRQGVFECCLPRLPLRSGTYDCNLFCSVNGEIVDWLQSAFTLEVEDGDYYGTGRLISRDQGDLLLDHRWQSLPG